jgi:hypothetical protein
LQVATVQLLLVHVDVPFAAKQMVPQAPQLLGLFEVLTSQPSPALPLQSARGAVQLLMPQTPFTQFGCEPLPPGQTLPQIPQLLTLLLVLTSQPFAGLPSQLAKPALQFSTQLPALQVGVALFVPQMLPQAPQLAVLLVRLASQPSLSRPLQSAQPELQLAMAQVPPSHLGVACGSRQTLPHEPQLLTSEVLLDSQPLAVLPSQLA